MPRVRAAVTVPGLASEAETLWYDPQRWPSWIDGFGHVVKVEGEWPDRGARVVWDSKPGGRGRVVERVAAYEARTGQTLQVEDEKLRGTQRVSFAPQPEGVEVALELEYDLKETNVLTPVTDLLFIRRALRDSLSRSLTRFARERRAEMDPA
jgi:Polyketide cyclase / dehydrase and lipid transport